MPDTPTPDELAAFEAWKAAQASGSPALATAAPLEYAFKVGQLVKAAGGHALILETGPAPRDVTSTDAEGNTSTVTAVAPGYRIGYLTGVIDSPHTAQELGLEAL